MKKKPLILIADSGSSKTSWVGISKNEIVFTYECAGLNPNFLQEYEFEAEITALASQVQTENVREIHFYGSGCSSAVNKQFVRDLLSRFFGKATIEVDSDLIAAAIALSSGEQHIVGIIGTGSNICLYDGDNINYAVPSYGYIFGDFGSGAVIGKETLSRYFNNEMPVELKSSFAEWIGMSDDAIIARVYKESRPNRFLASITLFHALHMDDVFLRRIRMESFLNFFIKQADRIENGKQFEVKLCGSVAWAFRKEIAFVAEEAGYTCAEIVKSPMEGLIRYYSGKR